MNANLRVMASSPLSRLKERACAAKDRTVAIRHSTQLAPLTAGGFDQLQRLLDVSAVEDLPPWLADRPWYADFQRSLVRGLAAIPLVKLDDETVAAASGVDLPSGDEAMTWDDVYRLGSDLAPDRTPDGCIAQDCSAVAQAWTEARLGATMI
jgi:hypothetical protein